MRLLAVEHIDTLLDGRGVRDLDIVDNHTRCLATLGLAAVLEHIDHKI